MGWQGRVSVEVTLRLRLKAWKEQGTECSGQREDRRRALRLGRGLLDRGRRLLWCGTVRQAGACRALRPGEVGTACLMHGEPLAWHGVGRRFPGLVSLAGFTRAARPTGTLAADGAQEARRPCPGDPKHAPASWLGFTLPDSSCH